MTFPLPLFLLLGATFLGALAFLLPPVLSFRAWPQKKRLQYSAFLSLSLCLLAVPLYLWSGNPGVVILENIRSRAMADAEAELPGLLNELASHADNPTLLARTAGTLMRAERYAEAADLYKRAVIVTNGDPKLIVAYNKALVEAAHGKVSAEAKHGFDIALSLLPEDAEARYYLGNYYAQNGEPMKAAEFYAGLMRELPKDSPLRLMTRRAMISLGNASSAD